MFDKLISSRFRPKDRLKDNPLNNFSVPRMIILDKHKDTRPI